MTKAELNARRMADLLWERYCRVGLGVAIAALHGKRDDSKHALMSTALRTYLQLCKRHGLEPGVDWQQYPA